MDILICLMLEAYKKYGDVLKFDKNDIDHLAKKYNAFEKITCNEIGWFILYEAGYLSREKFASLLDIEFIDDNWYLLVDDFDDILSDDTMIQILKGDTDIYDWQSYDNNISNWWGDYTEETLSQIIEYCDENGLEVEIDDEMVLLSKDTLKIIKGDIFINEDEKLVDYIDDDGLEDLKYILNNALCESQSLADEAAAYKAVKDEVEDKIGSYEQKYTGKKDKNGNPIYKYYFDLNIEFKEIKEWLIEEYGEFEFDDENYGNLMSILSEMGYFSDAKAPDWNYINGYIDKETLNEITQNGLM